MQGLPRVRPEPRGQPRTPEYWDKEQMQVSKIDFSPKCDACAALCCVMLPFDAGEDFGFGKAGGVACKHLQGHACSIHADLADLGFAGCLRYDCLGAGQRVVQEVFAGQSWRSDPGLAEPMEQAFRAMRRLHEDHALLDAAARLPLTGDEDARRLALLADLDVAGRQTEVSLSAYETGPKPRAVRDFLAQLKARLQPRR